MIKTTDKEFSDLLASIIEEQTFSTVLTNEKECTFKQLNTSQLKDLVKTVVDSPLTQAVFNTAISKIMKDSLQTEGVNILNLNIFDRLIFILETRINSLSDTITITNENVSYTVDLKEILKKLRASLANSPEILKDVVLEDGKITLVCGLPSIQTENQLNEEVYKNVKADVENVEELRKLLGEAFINEIAKTVKAVTISDQTKDLSTINFKARIALVESLPASLIKKVIDYVEKYKQVYEKGLEITETVSLPVDGSLFSLR
jgi:hypothetical protein